MPIIPPSKADFLTFCEAHSTVWSNNAAAIGIAPAQASAFKASTQNCRGAFDAAMAAREAAKAATTTQDGQFAQARLLAGDVVRLIKAFAENQANPSTVYALAQIAPPAPPTPMPVPGRPTDIVVSLEPTGAVTLSWAASEAAASGGAFFTVARRLPGQTGFTSIGGAPGSTAQSRRMSFTDATVPTSAAGAGAQYIIQGRRGTRLGEPCDAVTVQFGIDGGGFSVVGGQAGLKMAA